MHKDSVAVVPHPPFMLESLAHPARRAIRIQLPNMCCLSFGSGVPFIVVTLSQVFWIQPLRSESTPAQEWRDAIVRKQIIPNDTASRRTVVFARAEILPPSRRASPEFIGRLFSLPGRNVPNASSVVWDFSVLDKTVTEPKTEPSAPDAKRVKELRQYLFEDQATAHAYEELLPLYKEREELERKSANKEPDAETNIRKQILTARINAINDSAKIIAFHKEYTSLTEPASEDNKTAVWSPAFEDWNSKDGWTEHELQFSHDGETQVCRCSIKSIGVQQAPLTPIPNGAARVVGLILMRQPELTLTKKQRKPFFYDLRDAWVNRKELWLDPFPILTFPNGTWDDENIDLHISAAYGQIRWSDTFIFAVTIQIPTNNTSER